MICRLSRLADYPIEWCRRRKVCAEFSENQTEIAADIVLTDNYMSIRYCINCVYGLWNLKMNVSSGLAVSFVVRPFNSLRKVASKRKKFTLNLLYCLLCIYILNKQIRKSIWLAIHWD